MIWNDDKIARLMSFGMMHGVAGGDNAGGPGDGTGGSVGSGGDDDEGGQGDGLSGLGQELSVDLGGGQSLSVNSVTGNVTDTSPGGISGGESGTRSRELGLTVGKAASDFGTFLSNLDAKQTGGILGAIGGTLLGIGPLAGAVSGARIGGLAGPKDTDLSQTAPGGAPPGTAQAAPGQQQQLAGVPSAGGLAGGLTQGQLGGNGGNGAPAQQLAAAGRQSGLAAAPAPVNPFLSQRPQLGGQQLLNRSGVLPQVNLNAFPGAIGGIG